MYQQRISKMRDGPGKTALKQKALKVLQRRKMYESQKEQLEQQQWNMQQAGMMQDNLKSMRVFLLLLGAGLGVKMRWFWWTVLGQMILWGVAVGVRGVWRATFGTMLRKADVMTTVDALKTTNKELKKQYGKINIDKSKDPLAVQCGYELTVGS